MGVASSAVGTAITGRITKPLTVSGQWLVNEYGKAVSLCGSHTWNAVQDMDTSGSYPPVQTFDFDAFARFLVRFGHNVTILWRKDLPQFFSWGAGGTWRAAPHPWARSGGGTAADGQPKFDLSQFDSTFFDRLYQRAYALWQRNIYCVVQLPLDGLTLSSNRGSADGYPLTAANNINGVGDGYTTGTSGVTSVTMLATNTITPYQDALVQKYIDVLNPLPNIIWEVAEEWPPDANYSTTVQDWWIARQIATIRSYEAGKPWQHPILLPTSQVPGNDAALVNFNQDVLAPRAQVASASYSGTGTPAGKVCINDSDHSYGLSAGVVTDGPQGNRQKFIWPNFCRCGSVLFMDPYLIAWTSRNSPLNVVHGVGTVPDSYWDNFRANIGVAARYGQRMNLLAMSSHDALVNNAGGFYCIANPGSEYLVYCPNAASSGFTVDLSAASGNLTLEWFDCVTLQYSSGGTVAGGAVRTITGPSSLDMVAYLKAA